MRGIPGEMSSRRSPGDGTVFQRKSDLLWVARVELPTTDGRRRQKQVTAKSRNEVIRRKRELSKQIEAGRIPTTGSTTVERWMQHWLETIHGPTIKPTTKISYGKTVRLYINPTIGSKRLDRLSPEDVRRMHRTLQESSTRNAQKAHQVLSRALKDAVNEGLLGRNVADAVRKPKHAPKQLEPLSLGVANHLIACAKTSSDEMWATRWALGFATGARAGEILGLEWSRVNLDEGTVDLSWQLQYIPKQHGCGPVPIARGSQGPEGRQYPCGKVRVSFCPQANWVFPPGFVYREVGNYVLTAPKTMGSRRKAILTPNCVEALRRLKDNGVNNVHGLVFHHPNGEPFNPDQDTKAWTKLLQTAGVPHQGRHIMRHSSATILTQAGIDDVVIQSILGHSDVTTTHSYQHADMSLRRQAVKALEGLLI